MTDTKKQPSLKKVTKKEVRKAVYEKIAGALAEYKDTVSKKKFENSLKKATRLFAVDIARVQYKRSKTDAGKTGIEIT